MKVFRKISDFRAHLLELSKEVVSVGLCPTMGALHAGHISLLDASKAACDVTIFTIFVNPAQFNNKEDLIKYPRDINADLNLLETHNCDAVFIPDVQEMYPYGHPTVSLNFGDLENRQEGVLRPGHFSGVGVVIAKLLNIIDPDVAFFGRKDLQQLAVVRQLIRDFSFKTRVESVDTVRESNGLAMSSRNLRLSETEQRDAAELYQVLRKVKRSIIEGHDIERGLVVGRKLFDEAKKLELEYLEVINSDTFAPVTKYNAKEHISICAAANVHGVRIIDNISL